MPAIDTRGHFYNRGIHLELQTRLVFIDTSAYEQKKFQFGHFVLAHLEKLVREGKIHLLITDVVRTEIEAHLKKYAVEAVTELKGFQKKASFLQIAGLATGGGLFSKVSAEAVLEEVTAKFRSLLDLTEEISIEMVNPKQIFDAYFSGIPPFHKEAKKSEFPDAFTLAAVDAIARERSHSVYIVSGDKDMQAVAEINERFIHLATVDALLDLVNRNDEELRDLSVFADSALEQVKEKVLSRARGRLEDAEFLPDLSNDVDTELIEVDIIGIEITQMQLIDVDHNGATYDLTFGVTLRASYDYTDFSAANWDREDKVHYGVVETSETLIHQESFSASLEIGFAGGLRNNAEVIDLSFDDSIFELDLENVQHGDKPADIEKEVDWPE